MTSVCLVSENFVATGGSDKKINIYVYSTGIYLRTLKRHLNTVKDLISFHDFKKNKFVSAGKDGALILWDARNTEFEKEIERCHIGGITSIIRTSQ